MPADLSVDVLVACSANGVPADADIRSWATDVLDQLDYNDTVEMSVRIVDENESRTLNRTYRGKDRPTNVLSFPSGVDHYLPDETPRPLGDLVLCAPIVEQEATEQGKDRADHWAHLIVHGTLHLLGFDHETEADAAEMESLEREILAARGVSDPYAA
jgi:probable rRNA maturation factor